MNDRTQYTMNNDEIVGADTPRDTTYSYLVAFLLLMLLLYMGESISRFGDFLIPRKDRTLPFNPDCVSKDFHTRDTIGFGWFAATSE